MSRPPRIMLSAGEESGDRLGAAVARALRRQRPDVELLGMGGDEMAAAGVRIVQHASEVAVMGIVEVLSHLSEIKAAMARLEMVLQAERPDVLVPIDFPDFNLRLAARARDAGVDVVYFVSPQIWAWRQGRVRRIRGLVKRMLVLFPFEIPFYEDAGVAVTFVGHPVVERVAEGEHRGDLLEAVGFDPARPVVALLPGSRRGEADQITPPLLESARILQARRPDLQFLVSRAATLPSGFLEERIAGAGVRDLRIHGGDFPAILTACAAGAVTSGTATLEAAMAGLPMVVVYHANPFSYAIGRRLVSLENVALPNLVAGRRIVPELIQDQCTGPNIAAALAPFLDDPSAASATRNALGDVRAALGSPGAAERAATAILREAERRWDA